LNTNPNPSNWYAKREALQRPLPSLKEIRELLMEELKHLPEELKFLVYVEEV